MVGYFLLMANFPLPKNLPHKIIKNCQSVSLIKAFQVSPLVQSLMLVRQWSYLLIPINHLLLQLLHWVRKFLNFFLGFHMQNPMIYLRFLGKGGYRREIHPEHFLAIGCLLFGSWFGLIRRHLRVIITFLDHQKIGSL